MLIKPLGPVVALCVAAALLTGCAGNPQTAPAPATPTVTPTVASTACGSCDGLPQADHTGPAALELDTAAVTVAKVTAAEVMSAYLTSGKGQTDWFAALAPMLTTGYAQDAKYIDPSRLPVHKVFTGPVLVPESSGGYQARFRFGTDNGDWVLVLVRKSANAPWLGDQIAPAAEVK